LTKGAKPIVIGKDFSIEHSIIKLVKANAEDNFEGQQIFTVPTANFDFDAFTAKVDISAFQPVGGNYEVKLYNNKGKVTLEAYKFKVTDGNDDPIGGGVYAFWKDAIDAIDKSGEAEATITLLGDAELTKMELPKTASLEIICEDVSNTTLTLKGLTSISPKANLTLSVPITCVDTKGNTAALTITVPNSKMFAIAAPINCKTLTLKGNTGSYLNVRSTITAESITGFDSVAVHDTDLTVYKTLTTNNLYTDYLFSDSVIAIESGATVTINESISGSGIIKLEKGAKPIVIGRNFDLDNSGTIILTMAEASDDFTGQQIFTLPTAWTADKVNAFLEKVNYDDLTDGSTKYETKLYNNKGKVTLEKYFLKLKQEGANTEYFASWADVITEINKTQGGEYTVTFLDDDCLVDLGATFKLPTANKCTKLTIVDGKFVFTGARITLTSDLMFDNVIIFDKNRNLRAFDIDYKVNTSNNRYSFEIDLV
ncbi:MAG: hypothetical protein J6X60_08460, partial [Ruminiclostridium sp.]|nr:hypothetical protein [Ruminiclostridium sp.]